MIQQLSLKSCDDNIIVRIRHGDRGVGGGLCMYVISYFHCHIKISALTPVALNVSIVTDRYRPRCCVSTDGFPAALTTNRRLE